jgi:hypothetical protein
MAAFTTRAASSSALVFTSVPLREVPTAVRTALVMTADGMARFPLSMNVLQFSIWLISLPMQAQSLGMMQPT